MSCPSLAAWSRRAWASARVWIHHRWSSVAGSGSVTGSCSRCQPSRHCAARSVRARSAHDGQTDGEGVPARHQHLFYARRCRGWCGAAAPAGCRRRARRPGRGRLHGPAAWPAAPPASSWSWLSSVTGHLRRLVAGPGVAVAAQAALGGHGLAVVQDDQAGAADRARLIGPPGRRRGHAGTSSSTPRRYLGRHGPDVGVADPSGADPHRVGVGFEPDERHPGADGGVGGDQFAGRAAIAGAVAEHHVHLLGLIQPHRDPVREQVPDTQHVLARVLQRGHHAVADRPALRRQGGQRGHDPLAELAVPLVGGQERDLIDQHHHERVIHGRDMIAALPGEPGRPALHVGHGGLQHDRDGVGVGGVLRRRCRR